MSVSLRYQNNTLWSKSSEVTSVNMRLGGGYAVRSNLNMFEHVSGGGKFLYSEVQVEQV